MMTVEVCLCAHTFLPDVFGTDDTLPTDGMSDTSAEFVKVICRSALAYLGNVLSCMGCRMRVA